MQKHALLITAIISFIAMPAYSNHGDDGSKLRNARQRFEKIDQDGDGLLSKNELFAAHKDRVEKMFINFDTNDDGKLSRKELITLRKFMKKRISESNNN
tara:strand:- start:222 stop:518 length:297 start_codon:yes stop_codon:yes gene_type:complete